MDMSEINVEVKEGRMLCVAIAALIEARGWVGVTQEDVQDVVNELETKADMAKFLLRRQ